MYRRPSDPEVPAQVSRAVNPTANKEGLSLLQSLIASIHQKITPKRALFSNIPIELCPDVTISVKGYTLFKREAPKRSCRVRLDGEEPRIAEIKTMSTAQDTGRQLEKTEIRKAFSFGGEQILFSEDELKNINHFGDPIIRIIGFKPLDMLPTWANVKEWNFMYPSEEHYVGSTRTFSALQQTMLRKRKFALVWFIARRNAAPVISALIPGEEKLGPHGEQIMPPGLWIGRMPFVDDIRNNLQINETIRAPDILKDQMRDVVQLLQLPKSEYDPSKYPNPSLQWHYRVLQAMALEEDMPEKPDDKTIPRYKQIDKRAGSLVVKWGNTLQTEFEKWQQDNKSLVTGGKRGTPNPTQSTSKKPKSSAAANGTMTDDQMRDHYNKSTLGKLTVSQLKDWCREKNISVSNKKKQELVELVENRFEDKTNLD